MVLERSREALLEAFYNNIAIVLYLYVVSYLYMGVPLKPLGCVRLGHGSVSRNDF